MASTFGAAFDKLPREVQTKIAKALLLRRRLYQHALQHEYSPDTKVVIIGDTPGPGKVHEKEGHHFTPFYSTKHSSLWLNKLLVENDISEVNLLWFNAYLANGAPLAPIFIEELRQLLNPKFILLGGNAETWFRKAAPTSPYVKVYHPQFVKRFKSKEPYALISEIKSALKV